MRINQPITTKIKSGLNTGITNPGQPIKLPDQQVMNNLRRETGIPMIDRKINLHDQSYPDIFRQKRLNNIPPDEAYYHLLDGITTLANSLSGPQILNILKITDYVGSGIAPGSTLTMKTGSSPFNGIGISLYQGGGGLLLHTSTAGKLSATNLEMLYNSDIYVGTTPCPVYFPLSEQFNTDSITLISDPTQGLNMIGSILLLRY